MRDAQAYLDSHPIPPRPAKSTQRPRVTVESILKAAADSGSPTDLVPVYDAAGNLIGVCPRNKITPVISDPAEIRKTIAAATQARDSKKTGASPGKAPRAAARPTRTPGQR